MPHMRKNWSKCKPLIPPFVVLYDGQRCGQRCIYELCAPNEHHKLTVTPFPTLYCFFCAEKSVNVYARWCAWDVYACMQSIDRPRICMYACSRHTLKRHANNASTVSERNYQTSIFCFSFSLPVRSQNVGVLRSCLPRPGVGGPSFPPIDTKGHTHCVVRALKPILAVGPPLVSSPKRLGYMQQDVGISSAPPRQDAPGPLSDPVHA